jgi:hypothetical protein
MVKTLGKHNLNQVIKINLTSLSHTGGPSIM